MSELKPAALRLAVSAFAVVTVAATFFLGTSDADAAPNLGMPTPSVATAPRLPVDTLPPTTGPARLIRQFVFASCAPSIAPLCRYIFLQVPANRLLQIDSISCFNNSEDAGPHHLIMTTSPVLADLTTSARGMIQPVQIVDLGGGVFANHLEGNGPYFFDAGERVYLIGAGNEGSGCGLFGRLFPTD